MLPYRKRWLQLCRAGAIQFVQHIIWQNDPAIRTEWPERSFMRCTSLTGSLFMLTDKPEKIQFPLVEAAIRSIPVMSTQPGQFTCRSSKSSKINLADAEMSGFWSSSLRCQFHDHDRFVCTRDQPLVENWFGLEGLMNAIKIFVSWFRIKWRKRITWFLNSGQNNAKDFFQHYEPEAIDKKYNLPGVMPSWIKPIIAAFGYPPAYLLRAGVDLVNVNWTDA